MLRGIVDLLSTSSNNDTAFSFLIAFDADCLSAARSHVNCYHVLLILSLGSTMIFPANLLEYVKM